MNGDAVNGDSGPGEQRHAVSRPPAYQTLADSLRRQITSGQLRPGNRLPTEPQLCATWRVSRSTVREALRLLASQNLIVTTRGVTGGSFVAHPSPTALADLLCTGVSLLIASGQIGYQEVFEVREMVEIPAAGLAARNRTEEQLAGLRTHLFDPRSTSIEEMIRQHRLFHLAVAAASNNELCELMIRPLHVRADRRDVASVPPDFWVRMDAEHREIADSISAGSAGGAEAASRRHMAHLRAVFADGPAWVAQAPRVSAIACVS